MAACCGRRETLQTYLSRLFLVLVFLSVATLTSLADERADELPVNGFPNDADFFPIGVWLQSPSRAANYKAIGINTFVGLYHGPTEAQLAALAQQNMFAITGQNEVGLKSLHGHVIKAWMQGDEPDNAQPLPLGGYGTCIPARRSRSPDRDENPRPDATGDD